MDKKWPEGIRISGNTIIGAGEGGIHVETERGTRLDVSDNHVQETGGDAITISQEAGANVSWWKRYLGQIVATVVAGVVVAIVLAAVGLA